MKLRMAKSKGRIVIPVRSAAPALERRMVPGFMIRGRRGVVAQETVQAILPNHVGGLMLWLDAGAGAMKCWQPAAPAGNGYIEYGVGSEYSAAGYLHVIRIYPYQMRNGQKYFSPNYAEVTVQDDYSSNYYTVHWSWDAVPGADGYRVMKYCSSGSPNYDYAVDVAVCELVDGSAGTFSYETSVEPVSGADPAGDTDLVGIWQDQSGLNHHAVQSNPTRMPVLAVNVLNGKPVMRFDAADDGMWTNAGLAVPLTAFVVYCGNATDSNAYRAVQGAANWMLGPYGAKYDFYAGGSFTSGPPLVPGAFVLQTGWQDTGVSRNYVNGVLVGQYAGAGAPGNICLGAGGAYAEGLNGDIAEVLVYNWALDDSFRAGIEQYLREKYQLT